MNYNGTELRKEVICLDTKTGSTIWNFTEWEYSSGESEPTSSPVISNTKIFVTWTCFDREKGKWSDHVIHCIDKDTGNILWIHKLNSGISAEPCYTNNMLYLATSENIYALNENTGDVVWSRGVRGIKTIAASNEKIFCFCDDLAYAFNQNTGDLIWNANLEPRYQGMDQFHQFGVLADDKLFIALDFGRVYCFGKKKPIIQIIDLFETENSLEQEIIGKVFNYDGSTLNVNVNGELQTINLSESGEFDGIIRLKEGKNKIEFVIDGEVYNSLNISTIAFDISKETYNFTNSEFTDKYALTYDQFYNLLKISLVGVSLTKADIIAPLIFVSTEKGSCYGMSTTTILYHEGVEKPVDKNVYLMSMDEAAPNIHAFQAGQIDHMLTYYMNYLFESEEEVSFDYIREYIENYHKPVVLGTWLKAHDGVEALLDALTQKYPSHAVVAYKTYEIDGQNRVVVYENNGKYPGVTNCAKLAHFDFNKENAFWYMMSGSIEGNVREVPYAFYPTIGLNTAINTIVDNFLHELTSILNENGLKLISVSCPVNVSLTDESGRVIADDGRNQIPNARVIATDDVKIFFVPEDLTYSVNVDAYAEGNFTLTLLSPIDEKSANATEFVSFVTNQTMASLLITPGEVADMKIDYEGDGAIDEKQEPLFEEIEFKEVAPEEPTGTGKWIPGFEVIVAVIGLLMVAYIIRR